MRETATRERLIQEMRHWGIRVTAQRLAVAEVLVSSEDHPTAQEVYERVQAHFPHITVGTVYNTINTLIRGGLIQPLSFPNGARYDTNPRAHANLVCVRCGSIVDALDEDGAVSRLRERMVSGSGFQVISQRVDFYGLCSQCASEASRQ